MTEDAARALAWMAYCKGAANMGNRDAGEVSCYIHRDGTPMKGREAFDEWWARYGRFDWETSSAYLRDVERDNDALRRVIESLQTELAVARVA